MRAPAPQHQSLLRPRKQAPPTPTTTHLTYTLHVSITCRRARQSPVCWGACKRQAPGAKGRRERASAALVSSSPEPEEEEKESVLLDATVDQRWAVFLKRGTRLLRGGMLEAWLVLRGPGGWLPTPSSLLTHLRCVRVCAHALHCTHTPRADDVQRELAADGLHQLPHGAQDDSFLGPRGQLGFRPRGAFCLG